jgi:glutamate transport system substrate-binding protein
MNLRNSTVVLAGAVLAVALTGCGKSGTPSAGGSSDGAASGGCSSSDVAFSPATPKLTGSPTYDKIKSAGTVKVGVKADQPNLGFKDPSGKRCGFDIEIAQLVAAGLGVDPSKIQYSEIPSANRESAIKGGQIDYYVGTYSITDKRKKDVGFAGPYFVAGQDLLVRKDETSITGKDTLKGKKVCSATGSTPIQRVRDENLTEASNIVEFQTYSECVSQLLDKKVDAVTTDDAILKGFAAQNPAELKVVGKPFSTEKYGIGLPHDDKALRTYVDDLLEKSFTDGTWQKIYDGTLGKSGSSAQPPKLERY